MSVSVLLNFLICLSVTHMPADLREVNKEEGLLILAQTIKQPVLFYENLTPFDSRLKKKMVSDLIGRVITLETQPGSRLKVSLLKDNLC